MRMEDNGVGTNALRVILQRMLRDRKWYGRLRNFMSNTNILYISYRKNENSYRVRVGKKLVGTYKSLSKAIQKRDAYLMYLGRI
jgi:hypothetical protein